MGSRTGAGAADGRLRHGVLIALALLLAGPAAAQSAPDSLPPGVTAAMIAAGKSLFTGRGLCFACHGAEARGGIGPSLADGKWMHHDGSYEALVRQITAGIPLENSKSGQLMPPRGGAALSDADLAAVAAYVWALARGWKPGS